MEVKTISAHQTQKVAQNFASTLKAGDTVALFGDLGAGKTVFVQGLARGLGIKKRILSPSFVFVRSYPIDLKNKKSTFHHIDLYRGHEIKDFQSLGLDEIFSGDSIIAIEWADRIKDSLPKKRIDVLIEVIDEKTRRIKIVSSSVISSEAKDLNEKFSTCLAGRQASPNIKKAVSILRSGGIIIFPTDTVYGIGCRFDDQKAIERLYQIKNIPKDQKFPILVSKTSQVKSLAVITEIGRQLISKYWPGALTIILPGLNAEKIGFRMPNSKLVLDLINKVGVPIIGTSANFHGQKPPKSFAELDPKIIKLADFTIKGRCQKGIQSTVVDATSGPPKILRQGAIDIN